jgi:hypothetical protein
VRIIAAADGRRKAFDFRNPVAARTMPPMKVKLPRFRRASGVILFLAVSVAITGCGGASPHRGRFPFSQMEKPPKRLKAAESEVMEIVMVHPASAGAPTRAELRQLRPGDVVTFHMSHDEAWAFLRKGTIQKLPYDLMRYGHLALVVPDPAKTRPSQDYRLLQIAMKQAVNAKDGLDYLNDKSFHVFRPPAGSVDVAKLHEFSRRAVESAGDKKKAYDYSGALGVVNAPWQPDCVEDIGREYTCSTLVVAGLHYSGFKLDAVHRRGRFDVVTPRQVVESRGTR